jgi:hypothetical protein
MLDVVNNLNDVMHASFIVGCNNNDLKSFGRLLKRDQLQMSKVKRNINNKSSSAMSVVYRLKFNEANKTVEIFLFEKAIIICKKKTDDPSIHLSQQTAQLNNNSYLSQSLEQSSSTLTSNIISSNNNNNISYNTSTLLSSHSSSSTTSSTASSTFGNFQYVYQFKEMLKTNEIGLTENLKNDKRKFEIWSDVSSYIFEVSLIYFYSIVNHFINY